MSKVGSPSPAYFDHALIAETRRVRRGCVLQISTINPEISGTLRSCAANASGFMESFSR
ncbi:hypothetical protein [Burkholderia sp. LMG 32019]|uniref:hypothetical protein n=1 Tax=Burkholderia sp. LMG 32019 TaxID=3158173 RepID=UPI003C2C2A33